MRTRRLLIAGIATLAAAAWLAPAAHAASCAGGSFYDLGHRFPGIGQLHASGLPARTDGIAPPCQVAERIADRIQAHATHGLLPAHVRARDAGWDAGRFACAYADRPRKSDPYKHATCTRAGRRVTMNLYS